MSGELPSVLRIEAAALSSWPALKTVHDGSWVWRWAAGHSRRANAVNFLDPSDGERAGERLAVHAARSRRLGVPPYARVTPLTPPEVVARLDADEASASGHSLVLAGALPAVQAPDGVADMAADGEDWPKIQAALSGLSPETLAALRTMLSAIAVDVRGFAILSEDGTPEAAAFATVSDGIAGLYNVVTAPAARRRGHGRRLLAAAFAWAAGQGARFASIQVQADNDPAVRLYGSFGLTEAFRYEYRLIGSRAA
jgi:ribosomal protein S18 acetylase RimI-like enzyme